MVTEEMVTEALKYVDDPEIGLDIITLGLVYGIAITPEGLVAIRMTLTSRGCPLGPVILSAIDRALTPLPGVTKVDVEIVWEPAWRPDYIEETARRKMLGR